VEKKALGGEFEVRHRSRVTYFKEASSCTSLLPKETTLREGDFVKEVLLVREIKRLVAVLSSYEKRKRE